MRTPVFPRRRRARACRTLRAFAAAAPRELACALCAAMCFFFRGATLRGGSRRGDGSGGGGGSGAARAIATGAWRMKGIVHTRVCTVCVGRPRPRCRPPVRARSHARTHARRSFLPRKKCAAWAQRRGERCRVNATRTRVLSPCVRRGARARRFCALFLSRSFHPGVSAHAWRLRSAMEVCVEVE